MSMHRTWKTCLGVFFLLTFLFLVLDPASATAKSNSGSNKYKLKVTVYKKTSKINNSAKQILAYFKGPKINNPGAGLYKMNYGKNKLREKFKHFRKGRPWIWWHKWHWRHCYGK